MIHHLVFGRKLDFSDFLYSEINGIVSYLPITKNGTVTNTTDRKGGNTAIQLGSGYLQTANALPASTVWSLSFWLKKQNLGSTVRKNIFSFGTNTRFFSVTINVRQTNRLAFCTTNDTIQKPENIKLIFEVKMSIVSNYKFEAPDDIIYIGDYSTHKGNPSLLRSDSMLKAIGKAINIRVSGIASTKIPIVVLGNSPITSSYVKKVDYLKKSGVVQGFLSINPAPKETDFFQNSPDGGFQTLSDYEQVFEYCKNLVQSDMNYFSSMLSKAKLGELITIANQENDDVAKAEKFLTLIRK